MIRGKVIAGKKIGRQLGFPTANLALGGDTPAEGVYAARVELGDGKFEGMAFVGDKGDGGKILEVNIFGLSEDIYGREIGVDLVEYIRPVEKFPSAVELGRQLARDRATVAEYFRKSGI